MPLSVLGILHDLEKEYRHHDEEAERHLDAALRLELAIDILKGKGDTNSLNAIAKILSEDNDSAPLKRQTDLLATRRLREEVLQCFQTSKSHTFRVRDLVEEFPGETYQKVHNQVYVLASQGLLKKVDTGIYCLTEVDPEQLTTHPLYTEGRPHRVFQVIKVCFKRRVHFSSLDIYNACRQQELKLTREHTRGAVTNLVNKGFLVRRSPGNFGWPKKGEKKEE